MATHTVSYPIEQAITDTSGALAGVLALDATTLRRILSAWVLKKIPTQDRSDVLQDLAYRALQELPNTPGLFYSLVRFRILDWWKARQYREHESLDDDEGETTPLKDILTDKSILFDEAICDSICAEGELVQVPDQVIRIAEKRVMGWPLTSAERQQLSRWRRSRDLRAAPASE